MFNRIRVVTMLMMVLGVFALLQLVSGHSENFSNLVREFSLRGQTVYALSKDKA